MALLEYIHRLREGYDVAMLPRVQGHKSVVVERHMGGAVRVSVAVVEGQDGPIALLPSQEEIICPEATFLDAGLKDEREEARREVLKSCPHSPARTVASSSSGDVCISPAA